MKSEVCVNCKGRHSELICDTFTHTDPGSSSQSAGVRGPSPQCNTPTKSISCAWFEKIKKQRKFDASSKGRDYISLNERLYAGPPLNLRIIDVTLRFREYEHAFCSDIQGAFLTIGIAEEDRGYLRFFWFPNDEDAKSYKIMRMNRVPFGVTLSPFVLAATIEFHIRKYKEYYRETFEMLNTSLYVDDLFAGSSESVDKAFDLSTKTR
ncbi:reverse transcriptase domain-containing protein [Trichonephila inaurata madagascariensis]|uniref:Reverse transcriptase domain-containing protein n=1 Tax=Trichonephila inaurata madagascariensis TaxID=2747483 RepID=A0A8X7CQF8_9ARAC|nr:reverse transcriptase domain-containing protein [Trichonephila inaurata madagascariensis]